MTDIRSSTTLNRRFNFGSIIFLEFRAGFIGAHIIKVLYNLNQMALLNFPYWMKLINTENQKIEFWR